VTVDPLTAWLDTAQADADAATPGPWHEDHDDPTVHNDTCVTVGDYGWVAVGPEGQSPAYDEDTAQGRADAEFIAHARTRDPLMVAAIRDVRERHRGTHQCVGGGWWTDDPEYRGRVATRGTCPEVRALSARLLGDDTPEAGS
jgi:hypothetical protein